MNLRNVKISSSISLHIYTELKDQSEATKKIITKTKNTFKNDITAV